MLIKSAFFQKERKPIIVALKKSKSRAFFLFVLRAREIKCCQQNTLSKNSCLARFIRSFLSGLSGVG